MRAVADWFFRHPVLGAGFFILILPFITPYTALAVMILVYGLYALGFNIMYGHVGLLSFGHSALLGGGAYACGIALVHLGLPWGACILAGTLAGTLIAFVMGALAVRTRGIYFAMVTLALSQVAYFGFYQAEPWTGGENGLRGVNLRTLGIPGLSLDFTTPAVRYTVIGLLVWGAVALLARILASPFGAAMLAVRENEARAKACGFDVRLVRLQAMTLSGAFCGLAGALLALHLSIVPIETLHYTTSGVAVMMAILGGSNTFFGPFVGAAVFLFLESVVSTRTEHWPLVVGVVFVLFILLARQGIWGTLVARLR